MEYKVYLGYNQWRHLTQKDINELVSIRCRFMGNADAVEVEFKEAIVSLREIDRIVSDWESAAGVRKDLRFDFNKYLN